MPSDTSLREALLRAAGVIAVLCLPACATTNPGDAAGIDYRLPRTDAAVTLGLDITGCSPLTVDYSLKIDPVAGAQDDYIHIPGSALVSKVTQTALTVSVDDNDVISSINAGATDKRAQILADVVKIAAAIAPIAIGIAGPSIARTPGPAPAPPPGATLDCASATTSKLQAVGTLKTHLDKLKTQALTSSNPSAVQKDIDAVAALLVAARNDVHVDVKFTVKPEDLPVTPPKELEFDPDAQTALGKLLQPINPTTLKALALQATLAPIKISTSVPKPAIETLASCDQTIPMPYAKPVSMKVSPTGALFTDKSDVTQTLHASQKIGALGATRDYCVSAGLGESRTVGLTLDKFGRVTTLTWNADASAANVSSALAGSASDLATLLALDPKALRTKAELDKLSNENALRQAQQCKAKLDAGGSC
jgi:hypothetical protein